MQLDQGLTPELFQDVLNQSQLVLKPLARTSDSDVALLGQLLGQSQPGLDLLT
jgi:hypothetical protein